MRLTTKGLLLIAIPALFELALLSGVVKAQADAADAERWALHGQDVLRQTTAILDPVELESVRLRGAAVGGDTRAGTSVMLWMDLDRRIDRLAELVADNPSQVERAVQIRQAVQAYRQWSDRIQDLLRSGRRSDVLERFRDLSTTDVLDRVRAQIAAFQAEERRLDAARMATVAAARERQQMLVLAAVVGSILFVAVAFGLLARGVRGRLAVLSDNARRLAQNEPLTRSRGSTGRCTKPAGACSKPSGCRRAFRPISHAAPANWPASMKRCVSRRRKTRCSSTACRTICARHS